MLNITFNLALGWISPGGERAWPDTLALLKPGKYVEAANAIRTNTVWVGQVDDPALRIAKQIKTSRCLRSPVPRLRRLPYPCVPRSPRS